MKMRRIMIVLCTNVTNYIKFNPSLDNRCAIDFSYLFMRMAKLVLNLPMRCTKGPLSIISL